MKNSTENSFHSRQRHPKTIIDASKRKRRPKEIVLIRHGESEGQVAHRNGIKRSHPSLMDCDLTRRGEDQALGLRRRCASLVSPSSSFNNDEPSFDLVCVSPLTRALATAVLGFSWTRDDNDSRPSPSFVCFPGLAERGSIPENRPRPLDRVKRDLSRLRIPSSSSASDVVNTIDFSLLPDGWPSDDAVVDERYSSLDAFVTWMRERPERHVAVVCHHNVILKLLNFRLSHSPRNCVPIRSRLDDNEDGLNQEGLTILSSDSGEIFLE